jgi:hypothetical protein
VTDRPLQSVKLLSQREDYVTYHIHLHDDPHRLPAIALDGRFYSFFRALDHPDKAINLLVKLSARGDQTVLTPTRQGYAVWVYESTGHVALPLNQKMPRRLLPTLSPADCWVIRDNQPGYRLCTLKVPDLPDAVPGLANGLKLYSLYRRETDAANLLKLAARLAQRGDELVILKRPDGLVLYIYEAGAVTLN